MSGEPWHWEPPGASTRSSAAASADGTDPGSGSSPLGRMVSASVRRLGVGGADQWVGGESAPALSGIAIRPWGGGMAVGSTAAGASGGGGGGASAAWDGKPGSLSINNAAKLAASAGIPSSQVPLAVAIAMAESGLNPRDHNTRPPDDSYGLWQINLYKNLGPDRRKKYHLSSDSQLFDPSKNAEAMADISGHGHSWSPWSTYNSGAYKKYMSQVGSALSSGVGDPVSASATPVTFGGAAGGMHMSRGGNHTTVVNVKVMYASYEEAVRIAHMVKAINDGNAVTDSARAGG